MNRSGSDSCTQPEREGGNSSRDQEPGRPGSPAPKALESGRTNRSQKAQPRPRDSPGSLHYANESLEEARIGRKDIPADAQGIKGTRVAAARLSRRRGGQATTHTRARPIRSSGRPQSPAGRPERRAVTRRSGPKHAEVPPIKERPAVGGRNPA